MINYKNLLNQTSRSSKKKPQTDNHQTQNDEARKTADLRARKSREDPTEPISLPRMTNPHK